MHVVVLQIVINIKNIVCLGVEFAPFLILFGNIFLCLLPLKISYQLSKGDFPCHTLRKGNYTVVAVV